MAKLHNYMKYVTEPKKVVALHLSDDASEVSNDTQSIGCWQKVGTVLETVSQTLENSRPGSKFPLFHRIGGEIPISRLEVSLFENELKTIKTELKKLPLNETRNVRFTRKGKAEITKLDEATLESFMGTYADEGDKQAANLYESFKVIVDLHNKLSKQAKKKDIGLVWRVLDKKELVDSKKKPATKAKAAPKLKSMAAGASAS